MQHFSQQELELLINNKPEPCVSIYMPAIKAGAEVRQNPIRFKNLIQEAEHKLLESGLKQTYVEELLAPLKKLIDEMDFWQHQSDGLAVFLSRENLKTYRLPLQFEELVAVANRFHLKPLLQLLTGDGLFYILTLDQKNLQLFQCSHYSIRKIELPDAPTSLEEALKYDDPERQLQFHTETPPGKAERAAMFHGQGVSKDDARQKKDILRFFQMVDDGLGQALKDRNAPLVLAGVELLLPIYQEANSYPHLLQQGIQHQAGELSEEELHRRGWEIVEPLFSKTRRQAAPDLQEKIDTGLASADIQEIVPSAVHGRVETLFVAVGQQQWGQFDPNTGTFLVSEKEAPGHVDGSDFAAVHTLLNRGTVYVVDQERMPVDARTAAVFRYQT